MEPYEKLCLAADNWVYNNVDIELAESTLELKYHDVLLVGIENPTEISNIVYFTLNVYLTTENYVTLDGLADCTVESVDLEDGTLHLVFKA